MASYYDNLGATKVTGTVHVDNWTGPVPVTGTVVANPGKATLPNQRSVPATTASVVLAGTSPSRKQLWIFNGGSTNLYLSMNGLASAESFFLRMEPDSYWELPTNGYVFIGAILGAWAVDSSGSLSGSARVTEVT